MVDYNALILAGGRSSRLGGTAKAGLSNGRTTLLASTLAAVAGAHTRIVVGPDHLPLPAQVLSTREDPPYSGPASGIEAGLSALSATPAPWTMVLAVDMPGIAAAVSALCSAAASAPEKTEGFAGFTGGVLQPLTGIFRTGALTLAFAQNTANTSVRSHLQKLRLTPVPLPAGATDDIDTWESARATGFTTPTW